MDEKTITVNEGLFEMLLNCIANLKFIDEVTPPKYGRTGSRS